MELKCNCNNPQIYTMPIGRIEHVSMGGILFYSQSRFKCWSCEWESPLIKKYDTGSPYTWWGKLKCKIKREHKELELILTDGGVRYACKQCGFVINDINIYNRLQKIKRLKKCASKRN